MSRSRLAVAALAVVAVLLVACGGGDDDSGSSGSQSGSTGGTVTSGQQAGQQAAATAAASNIKRGGTMFVALEVNPKDFDPMVTFDSYSQAVVTNVVEGLYKYNDKVEPEPWLAEKVDRPDPVTYVFSLRKGVKFHDGTEVDAEAVKFSMDRVRNNSKSPGYRAGQEIADLTVVDKYTVRLVLKEPNAGYPVNLTGRLAGIVSPTAVKAQGDEQFNKTPVGTGPFKNVQFQNDNYVRVEKWEGYWKQGEDGKALPYLDRIEWRVITEPAARLTALQAGDVQISPVRDQDLSIVRADRNLNFGQRPGYNFGGFYLMKQNAPFDNKALRQAVQYAIDREEIVKVVYEGNREVGQGPIPLPMEWAIDKNFKPFSAKAEPDKAKAKLAEGGRPNGFEFTWTGASGNTTTQLLAETLQAQLAKVGITMKIELADFNGVVIPKIERGEGQGMAVSWSTGLDPDGLMSGVWGTGGAGNYFKFSDPRVDDLIKQGRTATTLEQRGKAYKEMMPIIMDDASYVFLVYGVERFTGSKKVQGWFLGPKATTGYAEYWLEQ